jgi:hypothetical protein
MSGIWHMFCFSKPRADREKLVPFLESAGQIYPETGLTFEAPKCALASVMYVSRNVAYQQTMWISFHLLKKAFFYIAIFIETAYQSTIADLAKRTTV